MPALAERKFEMAGEGSGFDVVIIGAGHNGLAAAATLGKRQRVLDA
ncbi:MAG: hypothetical protein R3C42_05510 [Parvularculaceae bacterium]